MTASLAFLAISAVLTAGAHAPAVAEALRFSAADIASSPERSFAGHTDYRLVDKGGVSVLQARSRGQASARYLERSDDGIALMSDGDNAGGDATAWIAHIGFSASAEPPRCP